MHVFIVRLQFAVENVVVEEEEEEETVKKECIPAGRFFLVPTMKLVQHTLSLLH